MCDIEIKWLFSKGHASPKTKTKVWTMFNLNMLYTLSKYFFCLFVCMFVWGFASHSRIFHSYGNVTIAGEGLEILTYARHSWSLSSEGSLAWHTYYDTGHPFIMVISEDPWHSIKPIAERLAAWSCHYMYLFLRLRSVADGIPTPNRPLAMRML